MPGLSVLSGFSTPIILANTGDYALGFSVYHHWSMIEGASGIRDVDAFLGVFSRFLAVKTGRLRMRISHRVFGCFVGGVRWGHDAERAGAGSGDVNSLKRAQLDKDSRPLTAVGTGEG